MLALKNDIFIGKFEYRLSYDIRPCLIIDLSEEYVDIVRISSAIDLFVPKKHFLLDPSHPNFMETGLNKKSYILEKQPIRKVPYSYLKKKIGKLTGLLADEFLRWIEEE